MPGFTGQSMSNTWTAPIFRAKRCSPLVSAGIYNDDGKYRIYYFMMSKIYVINIRAIKLIPTLRARFGFYR